MAHRFWENLMRTLYLAAVCVLIFCGCSFKSEVNVMDNKPKKAKTENVSTTTPETKLQEDSLTLFKMFIRYNTTNEPGGDASAAINSLVEQLKAGKLTEAEFTSQVKQAMNAKPMTGNEMPLARAVEQLLKSYDIQAQTIETGPNRACLYARMKGSGEKKPILIMSHMDVVGVDRSKWVVDPFAAEEKDGKIIARGSLDDKAMCAAAVAAMIQLKKSGVKLQRDIVLLLTADEESGGAFGIKKFVKDNFELIKDVEVALNEGGELMEKGGITEVHIQCAEKEMYNLKFVATKPKEYPAHSSMPHEKNPVELVSKAVAKLATYKGKATFNDVTKAYFTACSKNEPKAEVKAAMEKLVAEPANVEENISALCGLLKGKPEAYFYNGIMRHTATATIFKAGFRFNVIPSEAEATVNVRLLPGTNVLEFVNDLKAFIGMDDVEIKLDYVEEPAPASNPGGPLFDALDKVSKKFYGEKYAIIPMMSTGATDSRDLRQKGIASYGLVPFVITPEQDGKMHDDNEEIDVKSYLNGVNFLRDWLEEFCK